MLFICVCVWDTKISTKKGTILAIDVTNLSVKMKQKSQNLRNVPRDIGHKLFHSCMLKERRFEHLCQISCADIESKERYSPNPENPKEKLTR